MILEYKEFLTIFNKVLKNTTEEINYELLVKLVKEPKRYIGIFRLTNPQTKLLQNLSQSREIKLGYAIEELFTYYIEKLNFKNLNKNIGLAEDGNTLMADQIFEMTETNTIYLIEQKMRDDHDSTKKRGQIQNFEKKINLLSELYPDKNIKAFMWFIDPTAKRKNQKYYQTEIEKFTNERIETNLYYGKELFLSIFENDLIWNEIITYIEKYKEENQYRFNIINFDEDILGFKILKKFKLEEPNLFKKLLYSKKEEYILLRKYFFPTNKNFKKIDLKYKEKIKC